MEPHRLFRRHDHVDFQCVRIQERRHERMGAVEAVPLHDAQLRERPHSREPREGLEGQRLQRADPVVFFGAFSLSFVFSVENIFFFPPGDENSKIYFLNFTMYLNCIFQCYL